MAPECWVRWHHIESYKGERETERQANGSPWAVHAKEGRGREELQAGIRATWHPPQKAGIFQPHPGLELPEKLISLCKFRTPVC